jgi:hypothetical protein
MPLPGGYLAYEAILDAPFPLFGLAPAWRGARHVVAVEGSDGRLTSAILGHGDPSRPGSPWPGGPWLKVESSDLSAAARPIWDEGLLWQRTAEQLLGMIGSPPDGLGKVRARRLAAEIQRRAAPGPDSPAWRALQVQVDGQPYQFRRLEDGDYWAAGGHVGDVFLGIYAHRFPAVGLRLVRITDLRPYVNGTRQPGQPS